MLLTLAPWTVFWELQFGSMGKWTVGENDRPVRINKSLKLNKNQSLEVWGKYQQSQTLPQRNAVPGWRQPYCVKWKHPLGLWRKMAQDPLGCRCLVRWGLPVPLLRVFGWHWTHGRRLCTLYWGKKTGNDDSSWHLTIRFCIQDSRSGNSPGHGLARHWQARQQGTSMPGKRWILSELL